MSAISNISNGFATHRFFIEDVEKEGKRLFAASAHAARSVYGFVKTYFSVINQMGEVGSGIKELVESAETLEVEQGKAEDEEKPEWRIVYAAKGVFRGRLPESAIEGIHGGMVLGGATAGALVALDHYDWFTVGEARGPLAHASGWLSFFSNVTVLYDCATKLRTALIVMRRGGKDAVFARKIANLAVTGVVTSMGYLLMDSLLFFGKWEALAIVLGGVASTTGCITGLYEYFVVDSAWRALSKVKK